MRQGNERDVAGRGGGSWTDRRFEIFGNDIGLVEILVVIGIVVVAGGGSAVAGLTSLNGLKVVLAGLVAYGAYLFWKSTNGNPFSIVSQAVGIWMIVQLALGWGWTLVFERVPNKILETDMTAWGQVIGGVTGSSVLASQPMPGVQPYDSGNALIGGNSGAYDENVGGGYIVPPTTGTQPTTTPQQAQLANLQRQLVMQEQAKNRTEAERLLNDILALDPSNQYAADVQASIAAENILVINRTNQLPQAQTGCFSLGCKVNDADVLTTRNLLAGNSYEIVIGASNFLTMDCKETAVIAQTNGWFTGKEYEVQACVLKKLTGKNKTGERFSVAAR